MLDFKFKKNASGEPYLETSLTGKPLLTTPQLNKGTAFSIEERKTFGLTGKLPTHIETLAQQVERAYSQYCSYTTPLQKNLYLNHLHDTNMVLFYKLVIDHAAEMIPIIYTPTVGLAIEKFSGEFNQARGLYISYEHQDRIEEILKNRSHPEIDLIVVSDGGGVLGIGDQGVGAMLIPVAKLMVYTICGGINPYRTLPILLDVGTDNQTLLDDPFYLGWRHRRVTEKDYDTFIAKFVAAVKKQFSHVFLHWEDFGRDNAQKILDTYRHQLCTFNDDIQGTGVVTLAALLAAVKANQTELKEQRIIVFGAGTAGIGIVNQICQAMQRQGLTEQEAKERFWLLDRPGLLTEQTEMLTDGQRPFARKVKELSCWPKQNNINLLDVIHQVKPTVLIGCSACSQAFTKEIVQAMASYVKHPIIFPLSNPTEKAEATPNNLIHWTDGQALIATGSPFEEVDYKNKKIPIAQCNNALVFPGLGHGLIAARATQVTDDMLWSACQTLADNAPINCDPQSALLPSLNDARASAHEIAIAVAKQVHKENLSQQNKQVDLADTVKAISWQPKYLPYIAVRAGHSQE